MLGNPSRPGCDHLSLEAGASLGLGFLVILIWNMPFCVRMCLELRLSRGLDS